MRARLVIVVAAGLLLYVLLQVDVTVPALSLVGLIAWALFSSALAIGYRREAIPRKDQQ
jgi:hypothetical protein